MKVLIAGGGTGGHINPGLAIAKYILKKNPTAEITFVGTKKGLETKLVPREGFTLETITVRGFRRKLSFDTVLAVKELAQSFFQASSLIKKIKPDVVIGTGGYVCGPVLYVAAKKGIPTLIHESNAFPGITNRLLEKHVNYVAVSFKDAEKFFKNKSKLVHTGNPVRQELLNSSRQAVLKQLDIVEGKPLIVAMGGSRGARKINETIAEMLNTHFKGEFNLIFATGEAQFNDINLSICLDEKYKKMVKVVPYIYDVARVYTASDLMICRAGAITISELQTMGIPSILVPSPYVTANHQEHNARSLERDGGAVVILESELNADLLYNKICSLISNRDILSKMAADATKNRITDSVEQIYALVEKIIK
ncbi:undecaprenyldiphospho-muramoylpentapeptide beta-N-acetylglucosaminyltransferase [Ruminiclostridium cellobioparum]|uniref:undecaprenyldiphospho-muramoylpentapeptide beta-N-acetylglucosaminyltransferase n=1 Tax=Ruminiclostridium cellobioparum TaxID=29355 RepID=UPI0028B20F35|nr:undecaprenyldiphospho-muramoylpentapeptide beta-N-acetylglucosaminyltransferase [Ruminiclostridium cellobioparum]